MTDCVLHRCLLVKMRMWFVMLSLPSLACIKNTDEKVARNFFVSYYLRVASISSLPNLRVVSPACCDLREKMVIIA